MRLGDDMKYLCLLFRPTQGPLLLRRHLLDTGQTEMLTARGDLDPYINSTENKHR
jgi:hypothetical protein